MALLDAGDRVLLLRASDPARREREPWWEIPGGGIDCGETSSEAAARELYEETGIRAEIGPCLWTQHADFEFAGFRFDQDERIHIARTPLDEPECRPAGLEMIEVAAFLGARWWKVADLVEAAASGESVIPPWLPGELERLLDGGQWPDDPAHMGEEGTWR